MKIKYIVASLSLLAIIGCSDQYRYPCQDPKHHSSPSCNPPVCEASGTCTKYLLKVQNED
jgi:hypothetical protein